MQLKIISCSQAGTLIEEFGGSGDIELLVPQQRKCHRIISKDI